MDRTEATLGTTLRLAGVHLAVCAAVLFSSIGVLVDSATAKDVPRADLDERASVIAAEQNLTCTERPQFVDHLIVAQSGDVSVLSFDAAMRALAAGDAVVLRFCS